MKLTDEQRNAIAFTYQILMRRGNSASILSSVRAAPSTATVCEEHEWPTDGENCSLGVGCDESGVCYASAMGQPSKCGRDASTATIQGESTCDTYAGTAEARAGSANMNSATGATVRAEVSTGDRLTDRKVNDIIMRGYRITGVVLMRADGKRSIVELGAVRWLTKDEMWALMHPDTSGSAAREL